ncbi:MAG: hypothetical protein KI788_06370 [Mameliella sp.]|nr:hypothetical protein [Mameliella sp.]
MKPRLSDETPDVWDKYDDELVGYPQRESERRESDDLSDLFDDPSFGWGGDSEEDEGD